MAQLLMQGTNFVNFIGRYCWVAAGDHGLAAVVVTERDEPQAVIGSSLHQLAYPGRLTASTSSGSGKLEHAHEHSGRDVSERHAPAARSCRSRRAASTSTPPAARRACGSSTSRSSTTRASPSGSSPRRCRRWASGSSSAPRIATAVAAPTTAAPDPTRTHRPENHEQPVHALYAYIYVTDRDEGLILVPAGTLARRQPAEQLPRPRADLQPRRHPQRGAGDHDRRDLCLHLLRRRPGGRRARRPEAPVASPPCSASRS